MAEVLQVSVSSDGSEISHKLNTRGNKAIIAKCISHKAKTNLYRARTKFEQVKLADVFPDSSYVTRVQSTRIFINENLTSYRHRILSEANEKRKDGELWSAWSMDRKNYVKTSPDGRPIKIFELDLYRGPQEFVSFCSLLRSILGAGRNLISLFSLPAKRFSCSLLRYCVCVCCSVCLYFREFRYLFFRNFIPSSLSIE